MENEQMDIIAMTRKLGAMLQQDDRYTAYHLAKQANDQDEDLQSSSMAFFTLLNTAMFLFAMI